MVVLAIGMVLTGMAIPLAIKAMRTYNLNAAVTAATGAIQSTRYLAVMHGYPYAITFEPVTNSYQISSDPPGGPNFIPIGAPVPITGSGEIWISRPVTFQFAPGGTVTETSSPMNMVFHIANIDPATGQPYTTAGLSNSITVSGVGNVSVGSP
jgi:Tfp pilus assembly protein FimT